MTARLHYLSNPAYGGCLGWMIANGRLPLGVWIMKPQKRIALIERVVWSCTVGLALVVCHALAAQAQTTPPKRCASIAKQEYDAAKKQNLLRSRFGDYVRTGRIGRRQYWYCHA